jgi:type I restriction enzyme S subunit
MESEWVPKRFEELCSITRGGSPRPIHDFIRDEGIPWVKIADATSSSSRFIKKTSQFIISEGKKKSREVFPGDLILSNSATPGIPRFMDIYACIHDGWLLLRDFKGIDKEFCFYFLEYERPKLLLQGNGSVFTNLKTDILKRHVVPVPPLVEQRAIAHILGTLDDKIELNRQMNETLEAMARAFFKSWFVDFDPVRAKAEGRDTGLPYEIAELFPDSFEDSELGEIPRGWEVDEIGNAVRCVGGSTPRTNNPIYWENGRNPFVTPKDMSSLCSPVVCETSRYITDEGVNSISSGQLPSGTVLLSSRAPIGYLAIADVPVSVNQGIIAMICDRVLSNYFVLNWTEVNMDTIKGNASGTTFAEISKKNFRPIKVVVPTQEILAQFNFQVGPLYEMVIENEKEIKNLTTVRDTLLPKLISGELRIEDPEKFLSEEIPHS